MAKLNKVPVASTFVKHRGWGYELWIENRPEYCGKLLHVDGGKRGSSHFHMKKSETMYLQSGCVELELVDPELGEPYSIFLGPGESLFIPAGQVHQIIAHRDSDLFEFSTQHEESDSYRVKKGD